MQRRALLVFATTLLCLAVPAVAGAHAPGSRTVPSGGQVAPGAGLVTIQSAYGLTETLARLEQAIQGGGSMVVARVDHAANARRVGKALRPTTLLIFGNPNLGTELMQTNQTAGIDLPQKLLVWQDAAGQVYVTYNAPQFIAARHGITDRDPAVQMIATALARLVATATATTPGMPNTGGGSLHPARPSGLQLALLLGGLGAGAAFARGRRRRAA